MSYLYLLFILAVPVVVYLLCGIWLMMGMCFVYLVYILFGVWVGLWDQELTAEGTKRWVERQLEEDQ